MASGPSRLPLIPWPSRVTSSAGDLTLPPSLQVGASDAARPIAELLASELTALGRPTSVAPRGEISLQLGAGPDGEGYVLDVTREGITARARTSEGLFRASRTIRQLAQERVLPAVLIEDEPRFRYRGLHLDVSRHFYPVEFIERYIDLLASFKLNTFHWHLTDDQGWRIEIRRYPRLTEIGSRRRETIVGHARRGPKGYDGIPHGGFYSQADVRRVVAYAAARHVTVLPEIEMPGHSMAALASYPDLACFPQPFEVRTTWGITDDVFCTKDATFEFLEGVLAEVLELFPSARIHVGADEAPKARWRECPTCQATIRREGLRDEHELQSWFIRRIERWLNAHGRSLIGWDEILEGGLAPNATVMSWRGEDGGIEAARQRHEVVMCPQQDLYFDHYQADAATEPLAIGGMTTLDEVYAHEPVPAALGAEEAERVLGPQGCVWTEYMPTAADVERMAYPRVLALAEIAWSPREARDIASFRARLPARLAELDRLGVRYRRG